METTTRTMAERAEDFGNATWDVCWELERMAERMATLWTDGDGIECDGTFDGTMPGGRRPVSDYLTAIENARRAVRLAHCIIAGLGE